MANAIYPLAKQEMLKGRIDLEGGVVRVALVDTSLYGYSDQHRYLVDVVGIVGTSQELMAKTFCGGVFGAGSVSIPITRGSGDKALVIYVDTGSIDTSPLIAYLDECFAGLTASDNSTDVWVIWDINGIFAL